MARWSRKWQRGSLTLALEEVPDISHCTVIECMNGTGAENRRSGPNTEEGNMDDRARFAVCGIDCMTCSIHLRTDEELNYWRDKNVDLDRIACNGCRSDRNACHWSGDCALLNCCLYEKGLEFCGECPDFPCDRVSAWAGEWEHHRIAVEKMNRMPLVGKDNWIRERLAEARDGS